jgi:hypothetical protein
MLETAGQLLQRNSNLTVFLDGRPFSRGYQLENVLNAAAALHQSCRILECVCPEAIAQARIEAQSASASHPAGNRSFELYLEIKARFEAITLPKTVIDTSQPLPACIDQALAALS